MFLVRNVFYTVILLTATCVALSENHDTGGGNADISALSSAVGKREKRGIDVNVLLRNLLLQSAQASDFKANLAREKARTPAPRPRPTTRRPRTTTPRPTAPPRMPDPVFNIFAFKNKFIPFNPVDYGNYDDTMSGSQTPPPRPRPRPRPTTTMPPPTTTAAPQPQPRPRPPPTPRRRPPPPPPPASPIHRFANLGYNQPFSADYGNYQYPNLGLGSDYDYEQDQQSPAPPVRRPNSVAAPRRRPAPSSTPAATPATTPAAAPRRLPSQLRNRVAYQYAQPADPSYDDIVPNTAQDDAIDYTDAANTDEDNAGNFNSNAANANADPGDDSDYADDINPQINNNGGDDANADDQTTAPLPPDPPRQQQQQQQDFSSSNYGIGYSGGVGSSSIPYVQPRGSYEFRNQFADFKTNFDGGYPQPAHNDGQYYSYYQ